MNAEIIDGTAAAAELYEALAIGVKELASQDVSLGLATIVVGEDPRSLAYEARVRRLAASLDVHYVNERLDAGIDLAGVLTTVDRLNRDTSISGIVVLRPLPSQVDEAVVFGALDPLKDIEALHPENAGLLALGMPRYVPSTPSSCYHLLDTWLHHAGEDPESFFERSTIVVVGRSNNVGRPAVALGLARRSVVISCDQYASLTGRLGDYTRQGDVLIVAAGVPGLIGAELVRPGAIVIDVGINPVHDPASGKARFVGDVDFAGVSSRARAITPVPGGVGPVTDVWLLQNAVSAARVISRAAREAAGR